jgi:adenylate cyclase
MPQLIGSIFNIWYNAVIIDPLLAAGGLRQRFFVTVIIYNALVYPVGVALWLWSVYSLGPVLRRLLAGERVAEKTMIRARRRLIHLPIVAAAISGTAWLLCIPVFLLSLAQASGALDARLFWHLPISFCVSAFIAVINTFFLVELASHKTLFPVFFRNARADLTPDIITLSLRGRGLLWAVSAAICPIASLLLFQFAPVSAGIDPRWFALFVGAIGIAFGLGTGLMMSHLVAQPIDELRSAAQAVSVGHFNVEVPVRRADEFGLLIGEFNHMTRELQEKERLRQTFGLHVGKRAAEQILARDPGLSGIEQEITAMFVDIRSFTARSDKTPAHETVEMLNEFLRVTVRVVEEDHGGMINKFLGDGFIALFGVGAHDDFNHAQAGLEAGCGILRALEPLNRDFAERGRQELRIGIGLHSGPAIVGSIGTPQRLEFTAIGATVNLASRIQGLTKQLATPLLLTAATRARLSAAGHLHELPAQEVRGVAEPVVLFTLRKANL